MPNRKRKQADKWVTDERQQAEQAVTSSQQQLELAEELVQQSKAVNRRLRFLRQRNMFAEGFRAIIREAQQ